MNRQLAKFLRKTLNARQQQIALQKRAQVQRAITRVRERSIKENIYHCCVHKTASQWVRKIVSDRRTYAYSGLHWHSYQAGLAGGHDARSIADRQFDEPFPLRTVVSPLYITYPSFAAMPKPGAWFAFFVARDPRDMVVSWYFSAKKIHVPVDNLEPIRAKLVLADEENGLRLAIDHLASFGTFDALQSWADASRDLERVHLCRFEDLTGRNQFEEMRLIFDKADIRMPDSVLREMLDDYSFTRLSGRRPGEESEDSQYRKGVSGDWQNHFTDPVTRHFQNVTGDLTRQLGYKNG